MSRNPIYIFLSLVVISAIVGCDGSSNVQVSSNVPKSNKILRPKADFVGGHRFAFSPDGKWIASLQGIRDTATFKNETRSPIMQGFEGTEIAFSADSKLLAIGSKDGVIVVCAVPSQEPLLTFATDLSQITGLGFTADNKSIIASSIWGKVAKYSVEINVESSQAAKQYPPKSLEPTLRKSFQHSMREFELSRDCMRIAVGDERGLRILDANDFSEIKFIRDITNGTSLMNDLCLSPDGKHVLAIMSDEVTSFSIEDDLPPKKFTTTHLYYFTSGTWCQNGDVIAVYYFGKNRNMIVELFEYSTTKSLGAFPVHVHQGRGLGAKIIMSPDDSSLAASGGKTDRSDVQIRLWDYTEVLKNLLPSPPAHHEDPN